MPTRRERLEELTRTYLTEDQGEPAPAAVVTVIATVGVGYLRTSAGVGLPVSEQTEYQQIAAYLVDRYLRGTRPSPTNTYLTEMMAFIGARLDGAKPPVSVPKAQLKALAALALGHLTDFMLPAARAVAGVRIAELFLTGLPDEGDLSGGSRSVTPARTRGSAIAARAPAGRRARRTTPAGGSSPRTARG